MNCAGARSAGNPHATCDVAGAGNQLTVRLVRHSQRKRGETDRPDLTEQRRQSSTLPDLQSIEPFGGRRRATISLVTKSNMCGVVRAGLASRSVEG
jgi:hypothetical protein